VADAANEPPAVSEPIDTSESRPPLDEALDWIVRLKVGEPTLADLEALQRWRDETPLHEEAFREAARLWRLIGVAARELRETRAAEGTSAAFWSPSPTRRMFLAAAAASSVAGYYALVRPPLDLWPSFRELAADYRTGKGERKTVVLAPEISLELSTLTSVAVDAAPDALRIELIAGQAAVSVDLPQPRSPLVVLAAGGRITAKGAHFDARCIGGSVSVIGLEGSVSVERDGRSVRVVKGEQVSYSAKGIASPTPFDSRRAAAWRDGLLVFRETPLAQVIDEVNRYRPGKIIIANAELGRRVVDGVFRVERLDMLVTQMERLFGVRATKLPGGVVLLG
jgi:transmembrane sensor